MKEGGSRKARLIRTHSRTGHDTRRRARLSATRAAVSRRGDRGPRPPDRVVAVHNAMQHGETTTISLRLSHKLNAGRIAVQTTRRQTVSR